MRTHSFPHAWRRGVLASRGEPEKAEPAVAWLVHRGLPFDEACADLGERPGVRGVRLSSFMPSLTPLVVSRGVS
jgi:hypothetical protein